jgi:hypothetical protein
MWLTTDWELGMHTTMTVTVTVSPILWNCGLLGSKVNEQQPLLRVCLLFFVCACELEGYIVLFWTGSQPCKYEGLLKGLQLVESNSNLTVTVNCKISFWIC